MKPDKLKTTQSTSALEAIKKFLRILGQASEETPPANDRPEIGIGSAEAEPPIDCYRPSQRHLWRPLGMLAVTAAVLAASSESAQAADLEGTLRNLVTAFTGRLLPVLAMGYLGKNIFSHVAGDPNAKHESIRVVVAIACLLGLAGVWNFIASQAR